MSTTASNDRAARAGSPVLHAAPKTLVARDHGPDASPAPSHDAIARCAYDIYLKKGRHEGHCRQNWYQAERELLKHAEGDQK